MGKICPLSIQSGRVSLCNTACMLLDTDNKCKLVKLIDKKLAEDTTQSK